MFATASAGLVAGTRVLVVDDHPMVREGLRGLIAAQPDLVVCGEAAGCGEAIKFLEEHSADVAIVDISLGDGNGIDLVQRLTRSYPKLKIIVLSAFAESLYGERALRSGALGYVNKRDAPTQILAAIRQVRLGNRYISEQMKEHLLDQVVSAANGVTLDPVGQLSNRELEVFRMIGQGLTTRTIAGALHLSVHTIESHREKIRHKLGLKNGNELMRRAVQWGLENTG